MEAREMREETSILIALFSNFLFGFAFLVVVRTQDTSYFLLFWLLNILTIYFWSPLVELFRPL